MKNRAPEWIILFLCLVMCGIVVAANLGEEQAIPAGLAASDNSSGSSLALLVNLNTATPEELESLPRIGPALAQRIVEYRNQTGGFTALEQLLEVKGIGETVLEEIKPYICIGE